MIEKEPQVSRRDFLKLMGASFGGMFISDKVEKRGIGLEDNPKTIDKKEDLQGGIRIIDNNGIKKDGGLVDVIADPQLIRENILERSRLIVDEEYLPNVENLADSLTFSFGKRSYKEILNEQLAARYQNEEELVALAKTKYFVYFNLAMSLGAEPFGSLLDDSRRPMIYMNTRKFDNQEDMKKTWDHEISHFIEYAGPGFSEDYTRFMLEWVPLTVSLNTILAGGATLGNYALDARKKDSDVKSLMKEDVDELIRVYEYFYLGSLIPTAALSRSIHYVLFDDRERFARETVRDHPTKIEDFNKMIKVVPTKGVG